MTWFRGFLDICKNLLSSYNWFSDTLDILLIAALIYWLITFVRRTNTANVLKGVLLLLAVLWLSKLLRLSVVSYLLGETFSLGFFALIVLFQPELRRILEQTGGTNFRGIFSGRAAQAATEKAIAQTVLASIDMSKTKTGALIIFERDISLEAYIRTGTTVDAEPAAELIKNIFYPKTPLHDGAMIIKNGRITSAAAMLPLSENSNLSRELGMRHRAGIGISERSDAVAAIVSEETGGLSVAVGGMLKRHLSPDTFEKILRSELLPKEDQNTRGLRKIFAGGGKKDA